MPAPSAQWWHCYPRTGDSRDEKISSAMQNDMLPIQLGAMLALSVRGLRFHYRAYRPCRNMYTFGRSHRQYIPCGSVYCLNGSVRLLRIIRLLHLRRLLRLLGQLGLYVSRVIASRLFLLLAIIIVGYG